MHFDKLDVNNTPDCVIGSIRGVYYLVGRKVMSPMPANDCYQREDVILKDR